MEPRTWSDALHLKSAGALLDDHPGAIEVGYDCRGVCSRHIDLQYVPHMQAANERRKRAGCGKPERAPAVQVEPTEPAARIRYREHIRRIAAVPVPAYAATVCAGNRSERMAFFACKVHTFQIKTVLACSRPKGKVDVITVDRHIAIDPTAWRAPIVAGALLGGRCPSPYTRLGHHGHGASHRKQHQELSFHVITPLQDNLSPDVSPPSRYRSSGEETVKSISC